MAVEVEAGNRVEPEALAAGRWPLAAADSAVGTGSEQEGAGWYPVSCLPCPALSALSCPPW